MVQSPLADNIVSSEATWAMRDGSSSLLYLLYGGESSLLVILATQIPYRAKHLGVYRSFSLPPTPSSSPDRNVR